MNKGGGWNLIRRLRWFYPGMGIKRWLFLSSLGLLLFCLGLILIASVRIPLFIELFIINGLKWLTGHQLPTQAVDLAFIVLGLILMVLGIREWFRSIYKAVRPHDNRELVDIVYEQRHLTHGLKVVAIGGGTGLSSLLRGLKEQTSNIVAVVTVSDDGGSSGRLREELGVLPPGDIRNCLVALATDETLMSELFQYRFRDGDGLLGHNFGNIFLAAMTQISGDFEKAVKESSKILAVRGRVLPATLDTNILCAELEDGSTVEGESRISQSTVPIRKVYLRPLDCQPLPETLQAIREADLIILGPGSLYTSIMPNLLVDGVVDAIAASQAIKIYVCNVMTQPGETDRFTAADHVRAIYRQTGRQIFDYCLVNTQKPSKLLDKYRAEGAFPVEADVEEVRKMGVIPVEATILGELDQVRHDPRRLALALQHLVQELLAESGSSNGHRRRGQ